MNILLFRTLAHEIGLLQAVLHRFLVAGERWMLIPDDLTPAVAREETNAVAQRRLNCKHIRFATDTSNRECWQDCRTTSAELATTLRMNRVSNSLAVQPGACIGACSK